MNRRSPRFTVVVPCHNYDRFLATALDSVLQQAREDVEIIVVDDASTDASARIADAYGPPVRVIRLDHNVGPGAAWAVGLEAARGEYVCKLDADDWQLPGFLDTVEREFDEHPGVGLVATGVHVLLETSGKTTVERPSGHAVTLDPAALRRRLLRKFFVRMPGTALRHAALEGHAPPRDDLRLPHDWEYFLRVLDGWGATFVPDPLAVYRVHGGSLTLTTSSTQQLRNDMVALLDATTHPDDPAYLADPTERRILAGGVLRSYLGSLGPRLDARDPAELLRQAREATLIAWPHDRMAPFVAMRYVIWGAWKRFRLSRRRTHPVDPLLPRTHVAPSIQEDS